MYRVYDIQEKCWLHQVYQDEAERIYLFQKTLFGFGKLVDVTSQRYVSHRDIGIIDANGFLIFEGDILRLNNLNVIGIAAYAHEIGGYVMLEDVKQEYYPLSSERSEHIEIIGNVFENSDLLPLKN